jgi:hypothetical protein
MGKSRVLFRGASGSGAPACYKACFLCCLRLAARQLKQVWISPLRPVESPISQSAPSKGMRDSTTGGLTVKVQSLEDVRKVLTSSLPQDSGQAFSGRQLQRLKIWSRCDQVS